MRSSKSDDAYAGRLVNTVTQCDFITSVQGDRYWNVYCINVNIYCIT